MVEHRFCRFIQVINNPRDRTNVDQSFNDVPQWNEMIWDLDDITDFATVEKITDVTLKAGMTPQQVLDLHAAVVLATSTAAGWG